MLVLSYGIPKSGSTLGFELARAVAEAGGHPQTLLPGKNRTGAVNITNLLGRENVERLMAAAPGAAPLVVKTHIRITLEDWEFLDDLARKGAIQVHAIYRDPREICLSLMDAGAKAKPGLFSKGAFRRNTSLDKTIKKVGFRLEDFRVWASISNALVLRYDDVAFDTARTVQRIGAHMGVAIDATRAAAIAADVTQNRFTQKNKAVPKRYLTDMNADQIAQSTRAFSTFIDKAIDHPDPAWIAGHPFARCRAGAA
jgi:hypothetical protein